MTPMQSKAMSADINYSAAVDEVIYRGGDWSEVPVFERPILIAALCDQWHVSPGSLIGDVEAELRILERRSRKVES